MKDSYFEPSLLTQRIARCNNPIDPFESGDAGEIQAKPTIYFQNTDGSDIWDD